jgi:hypothetical protein
MSFSRDGLGIQRRKKSTRIVGDAPSMGHVTRMHKNAADLRTRLKYVGWLPLFLLGLAVFSFGAAIAGVALWMSGATIERKPILMQTGTQATPEPRIAMVPVPDPGVLENLVNSLLAARTPRQLDALIRPAGQKPEEILAKLAGLQELDGKVTSVQHEGPVASLCLQLEAVTVKFDSGRNRIALVAPDPAGIWRVDFDAFDRHVTTPWSDLLSGTPQEGTVRVFVRPDNYYNGRYQNDRDWVCFGFASPDHETLMFGYTPRGGKQHLAMVEALRGLGSAGLKRMTLEIRHTGEGDRRLFEITRVFSDDWAIGSEHLDAQVTPLDTAAGQ